MTEIRIEVRYFAAARDAAGHNDEVLPLPQGATVAELRRVLAARGGRLASLLPTCRIAVGDDFADDKSAIADGAVAYIMPPVSGGSGRSERALVVDRPVLAGEATARLRTAGAGAIATFTGIVRDHTGAREVRFLDYEAHVALAEKELGRIVDEAVAQHELADACVLHRIGHLEIGEVAVDIAVSSAHRAAAFDGCRYIIEELKQRAPIWKRETDLAGSEWVTPTP